MGGGGSMQTQLAVALRRMVASCTDLFSGTAAVKGDHRKQFRGLNIFKCHLGLLSNNATFTLQSTSQCPPQTLQFNSEQNNI